MNTRQIANFCERYFSATGCRIIEKAPTHLKVKLSPAADRDLTGRPYYWSFIERTGAEPETMSFMFIFDQEAWEKAKEEEKQRQLGAKAAGAAPGQSGDSILGRYFGMSPILPQPGRMLEENIVYGSRRFEQIIASACDKGAYVQLFEDPPALPVGAAVSIPYSTWLGVNYKVDFICDMKREEIVSLGICMSTGEIVSDFQMRLHHKKLSPRIPTHTTLREKITLERAVQGLEAYVEERLKRADYNWARDALERMAEELDRIDAYYGGMLRAAGIEAVQKAEFERQYARRREEIEWQYRPRIEVCPINCGWYHLLADTFRSA